MCLATSGMEDLSSRATSTASLLYNLQNTVRILCWGGELKQPGWFWNILPTHVCKTQPGVSGEIKLLGGGGGTLARCGGDSRAHHPLYKSLECVYVYFECVLTVHVHVLNHSHNLNIPAKVTGHNRLL